MDVALLQMIRKGSRISIIYGFSCLLLYLFPGAELDFKQARNSYFNDAMTR